jgi:hypothetical protein
VEAENWRGRWVRDKRTGRIGKVTADLPDPDIDLLAVFFGPGTWNRYEPNAWSKEHLFELVERP